MSPLARRWISAAIGLPILVGVCLWGAVPFVVFTVVLALIARAEITRAYASSDRRIHPNGVLSLMGALSPLTVLVEPRTLPMLLLLLACGLIAASLWETGRASTVPDATAIHTGRNLAYGLLCGAYVSLFSGVALLRITGRGGASLVLLTTACTMTGDSAAFFVGRWLGRHKLAEGLSPNKSNEGLIGGGAASVAVGAALGFLLFGSTGFGLVVGGAAGLLGPLGDLFKSALKREVGIKDFGAILPGHGGILDRFDSLLFTAPVVVLLTKTFPV